MSLSFRFQRDKPTTGTFVKDGIRYFGVCLNKCYGDNNFSDEVFELDSKYSDKNANMNMNMNANTNAGEKSTKSQIERNSIPSMVTAILKKTNSDSDDKCTYGIGFVTEEAYVSNAVSIHDYDDVESIEINEAVLIAYRKEKAMRKKLDALNDTFTDATDPQIVKLVKELSDIVGVTVDCPLPDYSYIQSLESTESVKVSKVTE